MIDLENLTTSIWIYDIDHYRILWANQPALKLWESETLEALQAIDFRPMTSHAVQSSLREYQKNFEQGIKLTHNWQFAPNGIDKHAFCQISGHTLDDGRIAMLVEAIPISKVNYDAQVGLTTMISTYSLDGYYLSGNPPFTEAMGRKVRNLKQLITQTNVLDTLYQALADTGRFEGDVLMRAKSGQRWYHLVAINPQSEGDHKASILLHQFDINRRKMMEIALEEEVLTDPLTGLLNRRGLDKKLAALERENQGFVIYYIDLDGFKLINDSYGHDVGDDALIEVTHRIITLLPDGHEHFACRFGGDEFIVGIKQQLPALDYEQLAHDIVNSLSSSYQDPDQNAMALSASVGVALYPEDTQTFKDIIVCADAAMYEAKDTGKRRWVRYVKGMKQEIRRHSAVVQSLYYAEKNDELSVHYQPIWDFSETVSGNIIGFEALLRWNNSELESITTEEAIKVAEKIRIIDDIEQWVIRRALADLIVLREHSNASATMAINLSTIHLLDKKLPSFLLEILNQYKLKPKDISLELKENTLLQDLEKGDGAVKSLVEAGINISIDDFGKGDSSLAHLHQFPVNLVKIDGSFVQQLEKTSTSLQHVYELIKAHNINVLIEGVETQEQQQKCLDIGITLQQGYHLGKPKPIHYYTQNSKY